MVMVWVVVMAGPALATGIAFGIGGFYFQPVEKAFDDIYGTGRGINAEGIIRLWKNLDFWVGAGYYTQKGKLTFTKEETTVKILPVKAGLRLRLPVSVLNFYISGGLGHFIFDEENLIGRVQETKMGYMGKLGCYVKIVKGLYIDCHFQYSHCSIKPLEIEADIGGMSLGLGIGYDFGLGEKEEKWVWREVK